ncbi:MAG: endoglycoceramidase [Frankiales bacterium]|nr:endoglycoceramidase [Frankiales bacterium]
MRRFLLPLLLALTALTAVPASGSSSGPVVLHREGRFLADAQGRVVTLHGVNAVWKRAPYVPPATPSGFTAKDADWIAARGFNVVRMGVIFAGVMPRRGVIDHAYLDRVYAEAKLLTDRRIWVLLDFHQDLYSEQFSGEGFPAWAVDDDGLPTPVDAGFPGNYFQPSTSRAFDNFYANNDGLADLYAQAWAAVAKRFATTSYVLGYDLMNEPWPGTQTATCAQPAGCPAFDRLDLQPVYAKALSAIRRVDAVHLVWIEPQVLFNDGSQTGLDLRGSNIGLSFHQYCTSAGLTHSSGGKATPECGPQGALVFGNASSAAQANGWATLMTEFGASDDLGDISRVTTSADKALTGWVYWHYKEWADPTTESQDSGGQGLFADDTDLRTAKKAKLALLEQPYVRAWAGTPGSTHLTAAALVATWTGSARRGLTEVWVPRSWASRGYGVRLTGGTVVSKPNAQVLLVKANGPATLTVSTR